MTGPDQIGRYRILRKLGSGGMAEVYLAVGFGASGFERRVAIKILLPQFRGIGEYEQLLIEEAKLGARLDHRNLVRVHDLGIHDGSYFACMDFVDGADVDTLQADARLPVELALLVAEEIALALAYVHDACDDRGRPLGLVHRDVSPSNVLVSRHGEVKLADFGIAKATMLADRTLANIRKGKYAYMSPEQVDSAPLTPQSDQFGFGTMLVELVSGVRPFDGDSVLQTLHNIRAAQLPDLAPLGPALAAIAARCLARDPAGRFPSPAALYRAIADVRREHPPAGPPELAAWLTRIVDVR